MMYYSLRANDECSVVKALLYCDSRLPSIVYELASHLVASFKPLVRFVQSRCP